MIRTVVVLIHGTFAGAPSHDPKKWWQAGSPFALQLRERLPFDLEVQPTDFAWSGANSERDRQEAAERLRSLLKQMERNDTHYHIIAHSHGGSVLWRAFLDCEMTKERVGLSTDVEANLDLNRLRSWITVGTPFLHYSRPIDRWMPIGLASLLTLIVAGFPALGLLYPLLTGLQGGTSDSRLESGHGIVIGVITVVSVVFILGPLLKFVLERRQARSDAIRGARFMQRHGHKWLGIWSREDEAICGLLSALEVGNVRLPYLSPPSAVYQADKILWWLWPYRKAWQILYNWVIVPLSGPLVRSVLQKSAFGADRPGSRVIAVRPFPEASERSIHCPPLPPELDDAIIQAANNNATALVPVARMSLAQLRIGTSKRRDSMITLPKELLESMTGNELVHTSYFEHESIREIIAFHICECDRKGTPARLAKHVATWYSSRQC